MLQWQQKTGARQPACRCRDAKSFSAMPLTARVSAVPAACSPGPCEARLSRGDSQADPQGTEGARRPLRRAISHHRPSIRSTSPFPPDDKAPAVAANHGEFIRQHQKSERHHPEAEDRQETEDAADGQQHTDRDSEATRARHLELAAQNRNFPRWHLVVLCCHRLERLTRLTVQDRH